MNLVSRKQIVELESENRYLDKSIKHLENILEATHTYKKQEVSELNRIHVETIKVTLQHLVLSRDVTVWKLHGYCDKLSRFSVFSHVQYVQKALIGLHKLK